MARFGLDSDLSSSSSSSSSSEDESNSASASASASSETGFNHVRKKLRHSSHSSSSSSSSRQDTDEIPPSFGYSRAISSPSPSSAIGHSTSSSEEEDSDQENQTPPPAPAPAQQTMDQQLNMQRNKVLLMQSSLFMQTPIALPAPSSSKLVPPPSSLSKLGPPSSSSMQPAHPSPAQQNEPPPPPPAPKPQRNLVLPPSASLSPFLDMGASHARVCRSAFASSGADRLVLLSPSVVCLLQTDDSAAFPIEHIEFTLKAMLDHSQVDPVDETNAAPFAFTDSSAMFETFFPARTAPASSYLRLGGALFDPIQSGHLPQTEHEMDLRRKAALSSWLIESVLKSAEEDVLKPGSTVEDQIFALLTARQIRRAVQLAQKNNQTRFALLLAQAAGSDAAFKSDIRDQLEQWRVSGTDAQIPLGMRKCYTLLSGQLTLAGSNTPSGGKVASINLDDGLDWKRRFALRLWYTTDWHEPLQLAVKQFGSQNSVALPSYMEQDSLQSSGSKIATKDAHYQLLLLYSSSPDMSDYYLETALASNGFTKSLTDSYLPWLVYDLLSRAMRVRDFGDRLEVGVELNGDSTMDQEDIAEGTSRNADALACSFARQLESKGSWEWACFILEHLELPELRERSIKSLLQRNITCWSEESETFLVQELKVPAAWIAEARAFLARSKSDHYSEYKHLVAAGNLAEAHRVALSYLTPEIIIRNDLNLIRKLLEPLKSSGLAEWPLGGQLILEYTDCVEEIPKLRKIFNPTAMEDSTSADRFHFLTKVTIPKLLLNLPNLFIKRSESPEDTSLRNVCLSGMISKLMLDQASGSTASEDHSVANSERSTTSLLTSSERLALSKSDAIKSFMMYARTASSMQTV